ncbi:TetR/AcrR family transcriptional regulator [Amycolatopsis sp. NBC_01480]|uniref:TetR/AcrR family transcriptional regulator n=1 Tax=Amycolatopsis sp. NBC_01480 TaxID=2903562 RepID=UPI002E2DA220|nr:TetR/AcrR family transcriptional regulator [Amycolatopsis sp. NBC_01480]
MRTVDPAKHAAKRRAILDAAAGCFALEGFEKTSTAAICRAAGISSGSLFHYFPSKRAVFVGIFTEDTRDNEELLAAAAELDDAWAAVLSVVDRLAEPLVVPGIVRLVLEAAAQAARDPEFAALIRANDERMRVGLAGLVARGVEAGRLEPVLAPEDAGNWVFALVDALLSRASLDPGLDAEHEQAVLRLLLERVLCPVPPPGGGPLPQTGGIRPGGSADDQG